MVFLVLFLICIIVIIVCIVLALIIFKNFLWIGDKNNENKMTEYLYLNKTSEKGQIVFLGDSIIENFRLHEYLKVYPVLNRGIGGNRTEHILERLEDNVLNLEPSKIFIHIGSNDLGIGNRKDLINNYKTIIDIVQEKLPETRIFLLSITPVGNLKDLFSGLSRFIMKLFVKGKARDNENIKEMNNELRTLAKERDLTYIDVFESLIDESGFLKAEFTIEGLHLSNKGYRAIVEIIKPYL